MLYELQRVEFPAYKWRLLANSLRVASVVDNIDASHRDGTGKLQAVVSHWISNTTQHNQWITLVEAVGMCNECHRAKKLVGVKYPPAQAHGERSSGIHAYCTHTLCTHAHTCMSIRHFEHLYTLVPDTHNCY